VNRNYKPNSKCIHYKSNLQIEIESLSEIELSLINIQKFFKILPLWAFMARSRENFTFYLLLHCNNNVHCSASALANLRYS
jgi:hypothetical protein